MMDLRPICDEVREIARSAGHFIHKERKGFSKDAVITKDLNSLVSYVDEEAEKMIVAGLTPLIPNAGFITEESTEDKDGEYQWVIDPLDGTTNFIHGIPCYSVSIGLLHNNTPVLGVVYEINQDEMFYAWKDGGAFLEHDGSHSKIQVSSTTDLADSLVGTGFPYYDYSRSDQYLQILNEFIHKTRGVRRFGSAAVDLAWLAAGRFEMFYEHTLNAWDVCAGIVLVQEAGGVLKDFHGTEDYLYGAEMIATNKKLLPHVEEIVHKHWK